jgi:hypothetical protein
MQRAELYYKVRQFRWIAIVIHCHSVVIWLSLGCHLVVTRLSFSCHSVVIWLSFGCNLAIISGFWSFPGFAPCPPEGGTIPDIPIFGPLREIFYSLDMVPHSRQFDETPPGFLKYLFNFWLVLMKPLRG